MNHGRAVVKRPLKFKRVFQQNLADRLCDRIPVLSTITNIVDIVQKIFLIGTGLVNPSKTHYYSHLDDKSLGRCILLLIPGLGNLIVGLYDRAHSDKDYILRDTDYAKPISDKISEATHELRDDDEFMVQVVRQSSVCVREASHRLRDDADFMRPIIQEDPRLAGYASARLLDDADFMSTDTSSSTDYSCSELRNCPYAAMYIGPTLRASIPFMTSWIASFEKDCASGKIRASRTLNHRLISPRQYMDPSIERTAFNTALLTALDGAEETQGQTYMRD